MKNTFFVLMLAVASSAIAEDDGYCEIEDYEISKYVIEGDTAIIKFGDEIAGYYSTKEEYINIYDSAITSKYVIQQ